MILFENALKMIKMKYSIIKEMTMKFIEITEN